jgi:hypothetical protein
MRDGDKAAAPFCAPRHPLKSAATATEQRKARPKKMSNNLLGNKQLISQFLPENGTKGGEAPPEQAAATDFNDLLQLPTSV